MDFIQKLIALIVSLFSIATVPSADVTVSTSQAEGIILIIGGDVMLGRSVMSTVLDINDPTYPFINIADEFNNADLAFINLENPIVTGCPRHNGGFKFCTEPKLASALTFAGIDVISLANNLTLN